MAITAEKALDILREFVVLGKRAEYILKLNDFDNTNEDINLKSSNISVSANEMRKLAEENKEKLTDEMDKICVETIADCDNQILNKANNGERACVYSFIWIKKHKLCKDNDDICQKIINKTVDHYKDKGFNIKEFNPKFYKISW